MVAFRSYWEMTLSAHACRGYEMGALPCAYKVMDNESLEACVHVETDKLEERLACPFFFACPFSFHDGFSFRLYLHTSETLAETRIASVLLCETACLEACLEDKQCTSKTRANLSASLHERIACKDSPASLSVRRYVAISKRKRRGVSLRK